jgi:hypothetical protein
MDVIKNDFVLVGGDVVSNMNLSQHIAAHVERTLFSPTMLTVDCGGGRCCCCAHRVLSLQRWTVLLLCAPCLLALWCWTILACSSDSPPPPPTATARASQSIPR